MEKIYITSATRTAVGSLGKTLKNSSSADLGAAVIESSLKKSKLSKEDVDEVILGQVLTGGLGQIQLGRLQSSLAFQKKFLLI